MDGKNKNELGYKKEDNHKLYKSLEENPEFGISEPQNYIPLYNLFFALSASNYNNIVLNHKWRLHSLSAQETNNIFNGSVKTDANQKEKRKVFLKFSPLLDPIKYLLGKYDINDTALLKLPAFDATTPCHSKTRDYNNAAYVDSFFTYLSSKMLHDHGFIHGLDFYGSFLAQKKDFRINIIDDIDYLNDSVFFRKNDKILYELEDIDIDELNSDTRNYKKKLNFDAVDTSVPLLEFDDVTVTELANSNSNNTSDSAVELVLLTEFNIDKKSPTQSLSKTSSHADSCSSRSSNSTNGAADEDMEEASSEADTSEDMEAAESEDMESASEAAESEADTSSEDMEADTDDGEECLMAKIKTFPVQVIALEHCDNTLDQLMTSDDITAEMWDTVVIQILFSLIAFQNAFGLTHNDLHTNNVMYIETDKKFFYYKINHVYYKVPTYGKLFKIIDYGRAIYKFRGKVLCSDSYHPEGDAATQYNCEPYFNDKKPRLEPNMGFDLCRLGCALYDFLIDEPKTKITQIMLDWVKDDKGRNILYKKNGDERYPDFKLYKMIARTANKHTPHLVLNNPYFDKFIVPKKEIKKQTAVMDLDEIPCYM
jgi:hypothetical protein